MNWQNIANPGGTSLPASAGQPQMPSNGWFDAVTGNPAAPPLQGPYGQSPGHSGGPTKGVDPYESELAKKELYMAWGNAKEKCAAGDAAACGQARMYEASIDQLEERQRETSRFGAGNRQREYEEKWAREHPGEGLMGMSQPRGR